MDKAAHQQQYWEADHVRRRRPPTHPAVRSFVTPKLAFFQESLEVALGSQLSGMSVLDVGAGNGYFTHYLSEIFGRVMAVDFSDAILQANPASEKVLADVNSLPFPDRSFDVVFCSNLLHHVGDPQRAIDEMARVANSALAISEPNRNNPLMFLFGATVSSERGTLRFTGRFLRNLLVRARPPLEPTGFRTQGLMVPNKVPTWAVPMVRFVEPIMVPRMYLLAVARTAPPPGSHSTSR